MTESLGLSLREKELEAENNRLKKENTELAQAFRNLARGDINRRLAGLYTDLNGSYTVNGHKTVTLTDSFGILTQYQVPETLRDLLLEDNPDGELEIDIAPLTPRGEMFIRNPQTKAWIMVGADVMPYVHPQFPSSKPLSKAGEAANVYGDLLKSDFVTGYYHAEKLIHAVRQIASLNDKLA